MPMRAWRAVPCTRRWCGAAHTHRLSRRVASGRACMQTLSQRPCCVGAAAQARGGCGGVRRERQPLGPRGRRRRGVEAVPGAGGDQGSLADALRV
eukprot:2346706-Prymnesium_polylepis.1